MSTKERKRSLNIKIGLNMLFMQYKLIYRF